jgi:carbon-monoxide dehydrogenase medium subunit
MIPPKFDYIAPASLQEAVALLSSHPDDAKVLAGGQSLLSVLKLRLARPGLLIDLGRIGGLSYIRDDGKMAGAGQGGTIAIGAMTTYAEMRESALLREKCPLLPQTAAVIGDVQVRNRGTLGGSLAHADPAADMPAAALALSAELKAIGPKGERWIRAEDFFQGLFATALAPDEILTEIRAPVLTGQRSAYLKAARRPSDFAMVGIAVRLRVGKDDVCEDVAIGVTAVTDKPYRATGVEQRLRGKRLEPKLIEAAAATVTDGVDVTENLNGSKEYHAQLARVYAARALQTAR